MYWLVTTAPPVASALMIWIIRVLKLSTRLTPDTAASPTEDTIKVSARPMVTLSACSAISGSSSATSACRGNRGVDVNLDDFMLSSVANDKKLECFYHTADAVEMQVMYTIIPLLRQILLLGTAG